MEGSFTLIITISLIFLVAEYIIVPKLQNKLNSYEFIKLKKKKKKKSIYLRLIISGFVSVFIFTITAIFNYTPIDNTTLLAVQSQSIALTIDILKELDPFRNANIFSLIAMYLSFTLFSFVILYCFIVGVVLNGLVILTITAVSFIKNKIKEFISGKKSVIPE